MTRSIKADGVLAVIMQCICILLLIFLNCQPYTAHQRLTFSDYQQYSKIY